MNEMNDKFRNEVIEAMKERGLTDVIYVERARGRRCPEDDIRLEKFRGIKGRHSMVAYACPSCRHVVMWSLRTYKVLPVPLPAVE